MNTTQTAPNTTSTTDQWLPAPLQFEDFSRPATIEDFSLIQQLGRGAFGRVVSVRSKKSKEKYAMKILDKKFIKKMQIETQTFNEVNLMMRLYHPNLIKYVTHFEQEDYIFLIQELAEQKQLYHKLKEKGYFDEHEAAHIVYDVVKAVGYLHGLSPPIIHRDIKPENILFVGKSAKLTDFGWSNIKEIERKRKTFCGTRDYLAPEMILKGGHDEKVDIWTLGILVYELLVGKAPFSSPIDLDAYSVDIEWNILKKNPSFPKQLSNEAKDLVKSLLQKDPKDRPTIAEVLIDPWFRLNGVQIEDLDEPQIDEGRQRGELINGDTGGIYMYKGAGEEIKEVAEVSEDGDQHSEDLNDKSSGAIGEDPGDPSTNETESNRRPEGSEGANTGASEPMKADNDEDRTKSSVDTKNRKTSENGPESGQADSEGAYGSPIGRNITSGGGNRRSTKNTTEFFVQATKVASETITDSKSKKRSNKSLKKVGGFLKKLSFKSSKKKASSSKNSIKTKNGWGRHHIDKNQVTEHSKKNASRSNQGSSQPQLSISSKKSHFLPEPIVATGAETHPKVTQSVKKERQKTCKSSQTSISTTQFNPKEPQTYSPETDQNGSKTAQSSRKQSQKLTKTPKDYSYVVQKQYFDLKERYELTKISLSKTKAELNEKDHFIEELKAEVASLKTKIPKRKKRENDHNQLYDLITDNQGQIYTQKDVDYLETIAEQFEDLNKDYHVLLLQKNGFEATLKENRILGQKVDSLEEELLEAKSLLKLWGGKLQRVNKKYEEIQEMITEKTLGASKINSKMMLISQMASYALLDHRDMMAALSVNELREAERIELDLRAEKEENCKLAILEERNRELEKRNEELEDELTVLDIRLTKACNEALDEQQDEFFREIEELKGEILRMKEKALEAEMDEFRCARLQKSVSELKQTVRDDKKIMADLMTLVAEKDSQAVNLGARVQYLEDKVVRLKAGYKKSGKHKKK